MTFRASRGSRRCATANWCRDIRISTSLAVGSLTDRHIQANNRLTTRYTNFNPTNRHHPSSPGLSAPSAKAERYRGHHRRVRRRTPGAPLPLPRSREDTRPTCPDRDRSQRRAAQLTRTRRLRLPAAIAHGLPAVPRRPRPAPPNLVAPRKRTSIAQDPRQSPSMNRIGRSASLPPFLPVEASGHAKWRLSEITEREVAARSKEAHVALSKVAPCRNIIRDSQSVERRATELRVPTFP